VLTERFIRHGDLLTHVSIVEDPIYLSEPFVRTNGFRLTLNPAMAPYPCRPAVEVPRDPGDVPHHLPGRNPFLMEYAERHGLRAEATPAGRTRPCPSSGPTASPAARRRWCRAVVLRRSPTACTRCTCRATSG
jgi:hypothetical protein